MASWTNATTPDPVVVASTTTTKGVLRGGQAAANFDLQRYPVAPSISPFVERYWSVRWDRTGLTPFRSEVLTHPCVNLAVESAGSPTDRRHGFDMPAGLVHGLVSRRFTIDLTGVGRVFGVKFRPGGFTAFTGRRTERDVVVPLVTPVRRRR